MRCSIIEQFVVVSMSSTKVLNKSLAINCSSLAFSTSSIDMYQFGATHVFILCAMYFYGALLCVA